MSPLPHSPDLAALRHFLAILHSESLSGAAQSLGLTQSALSKQMQKLERQLGVTLLTRASRPVSATAAGQLLAYRLPALLEALDGTFAEARQTDPGTRQLIRLAMPDSLSEVMGAEFMAVSQDIAGRVELRSGISPWLEQAFRSRHFDLVVDSPPFNAEMEANQTPLFNDPFVIVAPKGQGGLPFDADGRPNTAAGAMANNVAYGRNSKFGKSCAEIALGLGVTAPPRFTLDSTQSLLRFVQAGFGWSITSALCLLQSPHALRHIDIQPCPGNPCRLFVLLSRPAELDRPAALTASRLRHVFAQLAHGPWATGAPTANHLLRAANPTLTGR